LAFHREAFAQIPVVDAERLGRVERVHSGLQSVLLDAQQEVVVRRHQTERVADPAEPRDDAAEVIAEVGAVDVVAETLRSDRRCAS